jgi:hypothetical protein
MTRLVGSEMCIRDRYSVINKSFIVSVIEAIVI